MLESVRARLALWHTATLALLLIAFASAVYIYLDRSTLRRTDDYLRESAAAFVTGMEAERPETTSDVEAARMAVAEFRFARLRVTVLDGAMRPIASTPPAPRPRDADPEIDPLALAARLRRSPPTRAVFLTLPDARGGFRVFATPRVMDGRRYLLTVEQGLHERREVLGDVRAAFAASIAAALVLAWAGGYLLAKKSLEPVVAMSAHADRLGAENLDEALPVGNPRDELGQLAGVFNALLGRIAKSMEQQRRFMADASHELRTPIAILRGEADIALSAPERPEAEYRESLALVRGEGRRLSRIVDDLFLLARADAGQQPLRRGELYLNEVAADCVRAVRSLAAERGITVECDAPGDLPFRGDEDLLYRLLLNLVDNAIKYSRPGAEVAIHLHHRAGEYILAVHDGAPAIPPDVAARVFERFYRADGTRARALLSETSGAGLGLSIARWVAEAHGGSLRLARATEAGNVFEAVLPAP